MNFRIPAPFPLPPFPMKLPERGDFRGGGEDEEDEDEEEEKKQPHDVEFISRLRDEGYQDDLIKMGLKVADNHSRTRKEALKIGENYIREMAK